MNARSLALLLVPAGLLAQETVEVVSRNVERRLRLPGEFLPYQSVDIHARVAGFVEGVEVDRGSTVKKGQLLVSLSAPEMKAQLAEIEARAQAIESQRAEAEARLVAAQSTYERLRGASATPGAVAGNELVLAQKSVDAAQAIIKSLEASAKAARSSAGVVREMEAYLNVSAPFDGVITERLVHPGALTGPSGRALLRIEQLDRLRLVVPVPETGFSGVSKGLGVTFTVPDQPGSVHRAVVARIPRSIDAKTRTMPVELDVENAAGRLAPGMYPEVVWPVRKPRAALLVPPTSIVSTTERTFVIRVQDGKAQWVNVARGLPAGDLVEVFGDLKAGDVVVRRGSDEIREGSPLKR